jgi:hypothetical protein
MFCSTKARASAAVVTPQILIEQCSGDKNEASDEVDAGMAMTHQELHDHARLQEE